MSSVTPFGIVNTTPFGTITFPVTVASTVILQLEGTVQGPETGGEHGSISQIALQPSPPVAFPSSQVSGGVTTKSPQNSSFSPTT